MGVIPNPVSVIPGPFAHWTRTVPEMAKGAGQFAQGEPREESGFEISRLTRIPFAPSV